MTIEVGQTAPDFTLDDTEGNKLTLSSMLGDKTVTVVFIPFAFTSVCQGELCDLRDNLNSFVSAGNQVVAITCDRAPSLKEWRAQQDYNFPLLSDGWPHGAVAKAYGCFNEDLGCAERLTVVVGSDGKVVDTITSGGLGEARALTSYTDALAKL
ncbi:MAG: redoxin domain-containing protein [Microthrixaceae bacterium]